jgi:hypothetical protein
MSLTSLPMPRTLALKGTREATANFDFVTMTKPSCDCWRDRPGVASESVSCSHRALEPCVYPKADGVRAGLGSDSQDQLLVVCAV